MCKVIKTIFLEGRTVVFSSILFLFYFLPITLAIYFLVPSKLKNPVLFIMSLVFYSWGEPVYVFLMLFATVFNYACGLLLGHLQTKFQKALQQIVLAVAIIADLSVLCFFKYASFFADNVNGWFGLHITVLKLALPIGISFYTFHMLTYVVDIYRQDAKPQRNLVTFGTYITMFPQLMAGPIIKYHVIMHELTDRKTNFRCFQKESAVLR